MANDFSDRQNMPQQLNYLAAQRAIYRKAKGIAVLRFFINVPFVVIISVTAIILNKNNILQAVGFQQIDLSWVPAFFAVVVTLLDMLILTSLIDDLREKAAKIQELFDTSVLGLPWNHIATGERPDHEDINKYSHSIRKNQEEFLKLIDWYSAKLNNLPIEVVAIICQRSNLCWDAELREYFARLMAAIAIFWVILLVAIGLYQGLTLKTFFLNVMVPTLPVIIFSSRQWIENKRAITQLVSLKSLVNESWENLLAQRESESKLMRKARAIQDQIFINRKTNPLIFDWVYEKNKRLQHESMYYSIDEMIDQYRKSIGT